ncbi:MAG: 3-phosphoshikimate 1-carboxyvinyltransferase [Clostridia bacterium]|nr:3-phosphoshikimate 1-carboxyvinyltransferase [Clostridia bacterium]
MNVKIEKSTARGAVLAPPSKSFAHRLLICAALAGKSRVQGLEESEDILATLDCVAACFGAKYEKQGADVAFAESDVYGAAKGALMCRESGSTMRFFIPLCLVKNTECKLYGAGKLLSRPMSVYENICREQNLTFAHEGDHIRVCGPLKAGRFIVPGNISSQFISGLMFALPLLDGESEICIVPPLDSKPYIDITMEALAAYGVSAVWKDEYTIAIAGGQKYTPADETVEGDYSNAAFLSAFNIFGGEVNVQGLCETSVQGDKAYIEHFRLLAEGTPTIDISDCPDLAPILMSVAAAKNGVRLTGTARLKIKESDRGAVMAAELAKFAVPVTVNENDIIVEGGHFHAPEEVLFGHNDHRVVMSMAVLASLTGGEIEGAEACRKSYPAFFDVIKKLGIEVTQSGN